MNKNEFIQHSDDQLMAFFFISKEEKINEITK